jgi:DNA-binding response OmpR family regulator
VVLDLGLPDEDGLDLLRRWRRHGDTTPVFVLTARHGLSDRAEALQAGAEDVLAKPFAIEDLIARIDSSVRRQGGPAGRRLSLGNVSRED